MTNRLFLDASYAIALAAFSAQHHQRAVNLAQRIEAEQARLITTRAVMLEIGMGGRLKERRSTVTLRSM